MRADLAAGIALTVLGLAMALGDGAGPQAALVPLATLPVIWRRTRARPRGAGSGRGHPRHRRARRAAARSSPPRC